jgi:hypothetical protein
MNDIYLYYDVLTKEFYDPWQNGRTIYGMSLARLDRVRVRLAVTNGALNASQVSSTTRIPNSDYQYDLSDMTGALFVLKTMRQYEREDSFTFASLGFDTTDTAWHQASSQTSTLTLGAIVLPTDVAAGRYAVELALVKSSTKARWTLQRPDPITPFLADVLRPVYAGAGLSGFLGGSWSISGSATTTDLTVASAAAGTVLSVGLLAPTGTPTDPTAITQTPLPGGAANTVRLTVPTAPGTGNAFNGCWSCIKAS